MLGFIHTVAGYMCKRCVFGTPPPPPGGGGGGDPPPPDEEAPFHPSDMDWPEPPPGGGEGEGEGEGEEDGEEEDGEGEGEEASRPRSRDEGRGSDEKGGEDASRLAALTKVTLADVTGTDDTEPDIEVVDGCYCQSFDSLTMLVEQANRFGFAREKSNLAGDSDSAIDHRIADKNTKKQTNYYNNFTMSKMMEAIRCPPEAPLVRIDEIHREIEESVEEQFPKRKLLRNLDTGDDLDAEKWVSKSPTPWEERKKDSRRHRVIKLGVNVGVNCTASPEELLYRGATAACCADVLQQLGHSVEIVAVDVISRPTNKIGIGYTEVEVKASWAPVDLPAIALAIGEVAFFRMPFMTAQARHYKGKLSWGWGRSVSLTSLPQSIVSKFDLTVDDDIRDKASAVRFIVEKLKAEQAEWEREHYGSEQEDQ